jgi:hypothetical protein
MINIVETNTSEIYVNQYLFTIIRTLLTVVILMNICKSTWTRLRNGDVDNKVSCGRVTHTENAISVLVAHIKVA